MVLDGLREHGPANSQTDEGLLSVIIPAYQAEARIKRAIFNVVYCAILRVEVVVVDDGSSDCTADLVGELAGHDVRTRLIKEANSGRSVARNRGIADSRGGRDMFLDADDFALCGTMLHAMDLCDGSHSLMVLSVIISNSPEYNGSICGVTHGFDGTLAGFGPETSVYLRDCFNRKGSYRGNRARCKHWHDPHFAMR